MKPPAVVMSWRKSWKTPALLACLVAAIPASESLAQFTGPALKLPTESVLPLIPTNDPALLDAHPADLHIAGGDVLTIHLFGSADFLAPVKVSVDGTVLLPLVGTVPLAGLTTEQASALIAQRLISAGMYKDPQITVQIAEAVNQFVTITGEVHAIVPLLGERRLLDVLSSISSPGLGAGLSANTNISSMVGASTYGWPPTASHIVTVVRQGTAKPIVLDLGTDPLKAQASNIVMMPHDLIILSRVGVVYVVGAFFRQGAIPLDQNTPLTLMQATSLSGGTGFEGRFEDLRIIRTEGLERKLVKADIKRILHGKDPDPVLQADDIIFLPSNALKAAIKSGGIGVLTNLADLAIIATNR